MASESRLVEGVWHRSIASLSGGILSSFSTFHDSGPIEHLEPGFAIALGKWYLVMPSGIRLIGLRQREFFLRGKLLVSRRGNRVHHLLERFKAKIGLATGCSLLTESSATGKAAGCSFPV